eukprot:scaffold3210_cov113-Cylindrotheca_fusiformis.AAC.4
MALPSLAIAFQQNAGSSIRIPPVLKYKRSSLFDPNLLKEETKIPREIPYTPETYVSRPNYNRHYSASDWLYNLGTWRNSSVMREIKNPVMSLGGWATFISVVHKVLVMNGKANFASKFCIPPIAHSFLEGRKIWENILSISRNLSRLLTLYKPEVGSQRRQRMQNLLAAFPYLLRHQVRSGCLCSDCPGDIDNEHKTCLAEPGRLDKKCWVDRRALPWSLIEKARVNRNDHTLATIADVYNRPMWVCDRLGQEVMGIPSSPNFTSRERLKLLGEIDKLANTVGSCERIHQTAVPLHYARHALRSLTVWLVTLPFSFVKDFGLLTGPVTAMIAWLLFGVYQIGHTIEDPFQGSLQLSDLCDHIRRDVLACDSYRQSSFEIESDYNELDFLPANPVDQETLNSLISSSPNLAYSKQGELNVAGI